MSGRLLALTALFIMVAEVLIFAPSVGRFRLSFLEQRLSDAHLALLAVEATPDGMVDMALQRKLLTHAGAIAMTASQNKGPELALHPMNGSRPQESYDLRSGTFFSLIGDALVALVRTDQRVIEVIGPSPADPQVLVHAVLLEMPMITEMRSYGWRILILSALISLSTGALVYLSLLWMLVHPLRRLSLAMLRFRDAPQDSQQIIQPTARRDEVGAAERALCDMQVRLRDALRQQARLAAVGQGVAKISHDLKGLLTTALLESDRLEQTAADPDVRALTQGLVRALERAVGLASSTLRFATAGVPEPQCMRILLHPLIDDVVYRGADPEPGMPRVDIRISDDLAVWADPQMTLRCLDNLLRNARQAGAGHVEICASRSSDDLVTVSVRDDGPGLPPKARQNLFVPFSGSARSGGTGLGLPIAREMAESQGGHLHLEISDSTGTCFVLSLPAG